jgi:hypothetical protein
VLSDTTSGTATERRESGTGAHRRQRGLLSDKVGMFHRLLLVAPRDARGRHDEHPSSDAQNDEDGEWHFEAQCKQAWGKDSMPVRIG